MMRSAISRRWAIAVRSARMASRTLRPSPPRGCRRRVSWKRRTSDSSLASRKSTSTRWPRACDLLEGVEQVREVLALPDVDAEGHPRARLGRARHQVGEGGDQGGGQVVHAEEAHVLEALDGVALPGAAEAGDHHEGDAGHRAGPPRGSLAGQEPPLVGGQDAQLLAILGHRPARDGEAAPLEVLARSPGPSGACPAPRWPGDPGSSSSPRPRRPSPRRPRRCRCGRSTSARRAPGASPCTCWW